jgi:hypothetical protein
MQRMFADDPETLDKWATASNTQIPLTVATCKKTGSIEAAACQLHALEHAPPELKKELPQLLRTCIDKYAPGAPGGVLPPG